MKWKSLMAALLLGLTTFFLGGCNTPASKPETPAQTAGQQESQKQVSKVKHIIYRAADKSGQKLEAVEIEIDSTEKNPYLAVLKRLVEKAPKGERTFPWGLKVNQVTVKDGLAVVDVNRAFLSRRNNEFDNTLMVYAIVDTLTEFKDVKKVTFTIEGKKLEILGQMDMTEPFTRNETFLKKQNK
jgi:germination protein M